MKGCASFCRGNSDGWHGREGVRRKKGDRERGYSNVHSLQRSPKKGILILLTHYLHYQARDGGPTHSRASQLTRDIEKNETRPPRNSNKMTTWHIVHLFAPLLIPAEGQVWRGETHCSEKSKTWVGLDIPVWHKDCALHFTGLLALWGLQVQHK